MKKKKALTGNYSSLCQKTPEWIRQFHEMLYFREMVWALRYCSPCPGALVSSPTDMICYNVVSVTARLDLPPGKWLDRHITPRKLKLLIFLGSDPRPMKASFSAMSRCELEVSLSPFSRIPISGSSGGRRKALQELLLVLVPQCIPLLASFFFLLDCGATDVPWSLSDTLSPFLRPAK